MSLNALETAVESVVALSGLNPAAITTLSIFARSNSSVEPFLFITFIVSEIVTRMLILAMCVACSLTSVPVCTLAGGCGPQLIDTIKIVAMTTAGGAGVALPYINAKLRKIKNGEETNKQK